MSIAAGAAEPSGHGTGHLAVRTVVAVAGLLPLLGVAAVTAPDTSLVLALPAALAMFAVGALFVGGPRARRLAGPVTGAVALVSVAGTGIWFAGSDPTRPPAVMRPGGLWPLLATAALTILVALVCRWSPIRHAVPIGAVAVSAGAVLSLPITDGSSLSWRDALAACMFWSLPGLLGAAVGGYLRHMDARRVQAIRDAQRVQRRRLAADLHDFIAHDVSAMVIQAQAARILLRSDPDQADGVLDRIESDGQRALASMDRAIHTLRELEHGIAAPRTPLPGVADVAELARRYADSGAGPIELAIEAGLDRMLHQEAGTTLYRVVVEALTNVRRHANTGSTVAVNLARTADGVVLTVTNDAIGRGHTPNAPRPGQRSSGVGLAGLAERVNALGGTFTAGPIPPASWQVRAHLPGNIAEPAP